MRYLHVTIFNIDSNNPHSNVMFQSFDASKLRTEKKIICRLTEKKILYLDHKKKNLSVLLREIKNAYSENRTEHVKTL